MVFDGRDWTVGGPARRDWRRNVERKSKPKSGSRYRNQEKSGLQRVVPRGVRTSLEPRRQILSHSRPFFFMVCVWGRWRRRWESSRVTDERSQKEHGNASQARAQLGQVQVTWHNTAQHNTTHKHQQKHDHTLQNNDSCQHYSRLTTSLKKKKNRCKKKIHQKMQQKRN